MRLVAKSFRTQSAADSEIEDSRCPLLSVSFYSYDEFVNIFRS